MDNKVLKLQIVISHSYVDKENEKVVTKYTSPFSLQTQTSYFPSYSPTPTCPPTPPTSAVVCHFTTISYVHCPRHGALVKLSP